MTDQNPLYKHCRYFPATKHNSGSSSVGTFYGNVSQWLERKTTKTVYRKYGQRSITLYASADEAVKDKRFMNFIIKIPVIDQHEYSSVSGWRKPGWDLGKPVCRVCSEFKITSFALCRYNKNIQEYISLWVWCRFHIIRWSAFNQFFVSWCSTVTLLNWGRKWKTRVSSARASSPFLPSCILEISSFTLKTNWCLLWLG